MRAWRDRHSAPQQITSVMVVFDPTVVLWGFCFTVLYLLLSRSRVRFTPSACHSSEKNVGKLISLSMLLLLSFKSAVVVSPQRTISVLSLHTPTLHGEDERKAGRTAHRITLQGRTAGSGCRHRAQGRCQQASRSWGLLALTGQAGGSRPTASTPAGRTGADRAGDQSLPCLGTRKNACRSERLRPAGVQLRFLLSMLLMRMKKATDRFRRDTIRGCHGAKRFLLLHHTLQHRRPLGSGKTVCRLLWSWSPMLDHSRRRASLSKQVLHLLIQSPRRGKEEGVNW